MNVFSNAGRANKWLCEKCNTWNMVEVKWCSWCGANRPNNPKVKNDNVEKPKQSTVNQIKEIVTSLSDEKQIEILNLIKEKITPTNE
jgi:hypothetical protein